MDSAARANSISELSFEDACACCRLQTSFAESVRCLFEILGYAPCRLELEVDL